MLARRLVGLSALACLLAALAGLLATFGAAANNRGRAQGPSTGPRFECLTRRGEGTSCEKGSLLGGDGRLAISPDGLYAYEVPYPPADERSALYVYDRDPSTGSLVQKRGTAGCIADQPRKGCQTGRALHFAYETAISPDGKNVYVSTGESLAIFDRDLATGELVQKAGTEGCINVFPKATARTCAGISGLSRVRGMAISPDGRHVYAAFSRVLVRFDRDPSTGALTLAPGPDARIRAAESEIAVSPDGQNLYALENGPSRYSRLMTFTRNPETGALTRVSGPAGCVSERGSGGCRHGRAMFGGYLIISPDGRNVYVASGIYHEGHLLTFDRLADGTLAQKQGRAECFSEAEEGYDEGCAETTGISSPVNLGIGRDGTTVFVVDLYEIPYPTLFARHPSGRLTPN